jgi:hypothetical protein
LGVEDNACDVVLGTELNLRYVEPSLSALIDHAATNAATIDEYSVGPVLFMDFEDLIGEFGGVNPRVDTALE